MIGDAGSRVLLQVLGYLYPAYLCFKDIEGGGKPDKLQLWCKYWVIIAAFTAVQPIADTFLFFIPFYFSLKLAFACYLWANDLEGTKYVYEKYAKPYIHRYEPLVDAKISQCKAIVSDVVTSNASRIVRYVQELIVKSLSQNMEGLKAESEGQAAPAAGYSKSESFKSASSGSSFFRSFSIKDE